MYKAPNPVVTLQSGPLTGGIRRDVRPIDIPPGSFLDVKEYTVQPQGLQRREGFAAYTPENALYRPTDVLGAWNTAGEQKLFVLTERNLEELVPGVGLTEVEWKYDTGTIEIVGDTVTGSGTSWDTEDIRPGDGLRAGTLEYAITDVVDAVTLKVEASVDLPGGTSYEIQRLFGGVYNALPDWVAFDNHVLIADRKRPVMVYELDTGILGYWSYDSAWYVPGGVECIAGAVAYFQDRVWIANTEDSIDGVKRQRIRWSALANTRDFSFATNYLDLPYAAGAILKMVPFESMLLVYFEDSIFVGIPTNNPNLPLRFQQLETGGIGLVNNKCVAPFTSGHFWVGNDNMYFTNGQTVEVVGEAVQSATIETCEERQYIRAAVDIRERCIVFGFPETDPGFRNLWYFNYATKAWSRGYLPRLSSMLSSPVVDDPVVWDTIPGTWDDLEDYYRTWDSIGQGPSERPLFVSQEYNVIGARFEINKAEKLGGSIIASFITGDLAFGDEDALKTVVRVSIKVRRNAAYPDYRMVFYVVGYVDGGRTIGANTELIVPAGKDEGYANMRITGSAIRFLVYGADFYDSEDAFMGYLPHGVIGTSVRVTGRGDELSLRT